MRLLVLLALLDCAIGAPRHARQTPLELANIPPQSLNTAPEQFLKHALFIPRGQEPNGFDPTKPIQGAFFISGDAQQFNIPPQFRLPQRQLQKSIHLSLLHDICIVTCKDIVVDRSTKACQCLLVSAQTRPPAVALPTPEPAVISGAVEESTSTTPAPTISVIVQESQPEQPAGSSAAAQPVPLAPAVVDELVTTTETSAPTLPVAAEQSTGNSLFLGFVSWWNSMRWKETQTTMAQLYRPITAAPASPQPLPPVDPNLPPVDKSVDLDGDGRLSLPEVQYAAFVHHGLSGTVVQGMFNEVDHNKDGFLNSLEFNDIRSLVLSKAENAAQRYLQNVDTDKNKLLSLAEAQAYILREHGIGSRDVERVWKLVLPDTSAEMDAVQFSKLRRRIRGMTIRLARQIMKIADTNGDGHITLDEAQAIAFEQEGIGAGDVAQMFASVDDNNDGELNAPEFADFERIVRARAVETSKKALRVVDTDGSNTLTMDEAKRIAFEHYGFDENILAPFFDQADENEDGHLDAVEFAGFRSVIRSRAVRNAVEILKEIDQDGDGLISLSEAEEKTKREDDMESHETATLFNIADQNKSGKLDKVELADFIRLVRLSAIRFATDHFKEFDANRDRLVTVDELAQLIETKYHVPFDVTKEFFAKVDIDGSGDLIPAEIVDFRHEIRKYVSKHPLASVVEEDEDVSDSNQHSPTRTNRVPRSF
ncbi:EF hand [Oesophagostomum dentatum]|uniref:EF hand n=1 Tax=Oesophagostomum dentatum TaxID=61180 RepID=A0A0B1TA85_OESDE|nr:EF hand [Oesophagostomum dentatum]